MFQIPFDEWFENKRSLKCFPFLLMYPFLYILFPLPSNKKAAFRFRKTAFNYMGKLFTPAT
mgnify:CR=1 FL=1